MPLLRASHPLLPIDGRELLSAVREDSTDELSLAESYIYASQQALYDQVRRAAHYTKFSLVLPCFPPNLAVSASGGDFNDGYTNSFPLSFTGGSFAEGNINGIELRVLPFLKIDSITYYDTSGVQQTLADTEYYIVDGGIDRPATLYMNPGSDWPSTQGRIDAVTITFWAGEVCQLAFETASTFGATFGTTFTGSVALSTVNGYTFADGDTITVSRSGNENEFLTGVPNVTDIGTTDFTTYYVVNSTGTAFELSLTSGGTAIALTAGTEGTYFAGTLSPLVKRVLFSTATNWWLNRCPTEDCSCMTNEAAKLASQMSLVQWNFGTGD